MYMQTFIQRNDDFATVTRSKLLTFFNDPQKEALLKAELAVVVDFGVHFVQTTYLLEGDGPLVFCCYEVISALTAAVNLAHYPNLMLLHGSSVVVILILSSSLKLMESPV